MLASNMLPAMLVALLALANNLTWSNALIVPATTRGFVRPFLGSKAANSNRAVQLWESNSNGDGDEQDTLPPQVMATGYSVRPDLVEALAEAVEIAVRGLPSYKDPVPIDLALVSISSLYDGGTSSPSQIIPTLLDSAVEQYGATIEHVVGCSAGGLVGSRPNLDSTATSACAPVESEGLPGVTVTLCLLPDVSVHAFHLLGNDIPEMGRLPSDEWKQAVGLSNAVPKESEEDAIFYLLPSPAFQNDLDDFLRGLRMAYPKSSTFGAISSTVSSLSRARLFFYNAANPQAVQTWTEGCVGVALAGDIQAQTLIAQGAKPVGGVYRILQGEDSTIGAIILDEAATAWKENEADDDEEGQSGRFDGVDDSVADAYARKASIPKPLLAEANFLMKYLSDDDQAFMRRYLLVGLERGGPMAQTPDELKRLSEGQGHSFTIHSVASARMKDGSVTLPLGSVRVHKGGRLRFFVRESEFAKKELQALWMGYKKKALTRLTEGKPPFNPTGCIVLPTLDRGSKFFLGKSGFESSTVAEFLPTVPSISGFYTNGVIGSLQGSNNMDSGVSVHGSAGGYLVFGSKSGRPIFSPSKAAAEKAKNKREKEEQEARDQAIAAEDEKRSARTKDTTQLEERAPRSDDGELILKRREVHSGRAISVSAVEWSVAEKTVSPRSTLEGFMWDKETEVDRFRERVPLANLVSQCRLAAVDPSRPKPRDWVGPVRLGGEFAVIPECKRMEPVSGSLRKRYDVEQLTKDLVKAGAPALSINCDGVLFGGSLEDITKAREAASSAAIEISSMDGVVVPPILASDLLLYPYQLYKLRLAGADAVNLVAGALASKDLLYLTKIASSLKLQTLVTVTSEVQIKGLMSLSPGSVNGVIVSNRELEDFSFDMSGQQALDLLKSEALRDLRSKQGDDMLILAEGRVGIIERPTEDGDSTNLQYLEELKEAGAMGVIVGGGLVQGDDDSTSVYESLLSATIGDLSA